MSSRSFLIMLSCLLLLHGLICAQEMPKLRYLMPSKAAKAMLTKLLLGAEFTVQVIPQMEVSPAFSGVYKYTDRQTREEYTVSAGQWAIINYANPAAGEADAQRRKEKAPLPDYEELKAKALASTRAVIKRLYPGWQLEPMAAEFSPTLKYLLRARLPEGHFFEVLFSYYDGTVRTLRIFPYLPVRKIEPTPAIDRVEALMLAAAYVGERLGAGWLPGEDAELLGFPPSLGPRTDDLGMPRLLYPFVFKRAPEEGRDSDLDRLRAATALVSVDAADGTVVPEIVTVPNFLLWKVQPMVYVDKRPAALFHPPVLMNGEPYLYLYYLQTHLWPGRIEAIDGDYRVRYGARLADISPAATLVRDGEKITNTGRSLYLLKGQPYLHYSAVAMLTGDRITWDRKAQLLEIETK